MTAVSSARYKGMVGIAQVARTASSRVFLSEEDAPHGEFFQYWRGGGRKVRARS